MDSDLSDLTQSRRNFMKRALVTGVGLGIMNAEVLGISLFPKPIKIGIIGLSVHSADFTEILNAKTDPDLLGCRVVAIYHPPGNEDVEFS